ncbi:MAG: hypothetical protein N3D12_06340 [Candidatus Methanomethyliaceae archaeon]|nr:hypothetical protein [Candidatus Methanomethyliaceae archaeon]
MAIGSSQWSGASLHVYLDEWGSKDVPIAVPPRPPSGWISGYKWNDTNGNGVWDQGEPALPEWTIQILDAATNSLITTTTTDGSGYYNFTGLMAGTYNVGEILQNVWKQTCPSAPGIYTININSGTVSENNNFGNKEIIRFLKIFVNSGSLNGYTKPLIINETFSRAYQTKTGPGIWWIVNYTVKNMDTEGHYYILWDKWGGNLLILNSTPSAFNPTTKSLTL